MKKRFVSAALAAVMALSMTACGSSNSAAETTAADTEAAESPAEETTRRGEDNRWRHSDCWF